MKTSDIKFDSIRNAMNSYLNTALLIENQCIPKFLPELEPKQYDLNGIVLTLVLLYALSAEIGLKAVLKLRKKNYGNIHDLEKLFKELPDNDECEILNDFFKLNPSKYENNKEMFMEKLEINRMAFRDWRYYYEKESLFLNLDFLRDLSKSIQTFLNKNKREF